MNASLAFNANALDPQIGTLSSHSRRVGAYNAAGMKQAGRKNLESDLVGFLPL
jgi:hypothetical protein